MNKKIILFGIAILMVAAVTATAIYFIFPYEPTNPPMADDVLSTPEGVSEIISANNKFAFELYSQLEKTEDGNIFYSPYSISAALAMTYEGANGKTAEEMKSVFHFPESNILRPNFAAIYNDINTGSDAYELRTGNALWVQQDYEFLDTYMGAVEKYYGGKATNLDFVRETEQSRQTINSFIEEQTNGKIKDILSPGSVDAYTRLVLTNAIYFKGEWVWEFDKSDTREENFKITPDDVIKVQMMFMDPDKARFNYVETEDLQILELPYKGDKLSMLIILPKQGEEYNYETEERIIYDNTLDDIELSAEKLVEYRSLMQEKKLSYIMMPKFEFDSKYGLNQVLSDLGMPTAFDPNAADFSGMTGKNDLYISAVIHQAYVKVDEKGTEAAAATAVVVRTTSIGPSEMNYFRADHPFIFIIQDKTNGNILFMGRVTDPTA